jgi:hypothetical protein
MSSAKGRFTSPNEPFNNQDTGTSYLYRRCWARHGISRLPAVTGNGPKTALTRRVRG